MESKHEKEFLFIKSIKTLLAPIHTVHSLSASTLYTGPVWIV